MNDDPSRVRRFEPADDDLGGHTASIRDHAPKQTRDLDVKLVLAGLAAMTVAWAVAMVWGAAKLVQDLFG